MLDGQFPDVAGVSTDARDDLFASPLNPPHIGLVSTRDPNAWTAARS